MFGSLKNHVGNWMIRLFHRIHVVRLPHVRQATSSWKSLDFRQLCPSPLHWSALTRHRPVDVIVGMMLHCVMTSLLLMTLLLARASLWLLLVLHCSLWKSAALLGLVSPLRLKRDTADVRQQLQSATVLRVSDYNLVMFQGLKEDQEEE